MSQVQTEILETRQAKIIIEVDDSTRQKEMKAAARRIAGKVRIPGFRKGKAPYNIIRQYYGEAAILEEALDNIAQDAYKRALDDADLEPYAPGSLDNVEFDPMVLTFSVPLAPVTKLNDYRSVRVDYSAKEPKDEDIEEALEVLRERQAETEPVDRALAYGDVAEMSIVGKLTDADEDDDPWLVRDNVRIVINEDATYPLPGFPEKVLGMKATEERSFELDVPDDEEIPEDMRGKMIAFDVTCTTVMDFKKPELTDEFAQSLGEYETVKALRDDLVETRKNQLEQEARDEYLEKIFEALDEIVDIAYPDAMLEHEVEHRIEDFDRQLQQSGLKLEDYKKINDIDDEKLFEDFKPDVEKRIRRSLILSELVEEEKLSVTDDDVEDEIATLILSYGTEAAFARQFFSSDEAKRSIRDRLLTDKAINRLMAIAKGEAPEIGAEPDEVLPEETIENEATEAEIPTPEALGETDEITVNAVEDESEKTE